MSFVLDTDRRGLKAFSTTCPSRTSLSWGGYKACYGPGLDPILTKKTRSARLKSMQVRLSVGLEPIDLQLEAYERALKAV
jgi:cystathionine beta-lyase/cystathionine gamma-synthase